MGKNIQLKHTDKIAITECMEILAKKIIFNRSQLEATLYLTFEKLINDTFGTAIDHTPRAFYENGEQVFSEWHKAKEMFLKLQTQIKGKDYE